MGQGPSAESEGPTALPDAGTCDVIPPQVTSTVDSDTISEGTDNLYSIPYAGPGSREHLCMWHRACEIHEQRICEGREQRLPEIANVFLRPPARERPVELCIDGTREPGGVPLPYWKVVLARAGRSADVSEDDESFEDTESEAEESETENESDEIRADYKSLRSYTAGDEADVIKKAARNKQQCKPCAVDRLVYELHPAMCGAYAALRPIPKTIRKAPLRFQSEKYNRSPSTRTHKVPDFWEPRPWDKPESVLSAHKSSRMKADIQALIDKRSLIDRACAKTTWSRKASLVYFGRFGDRRRQLLKIPEGEEHPKPIKHMSSVTGTPEERRELIRSDRHRSRKSVFITEASSSSDHG